MLYSTSGDFIIASSYTQIFDDTVPSGCGTVNDCKIYQDDCRLPLEAPFNTFVTIGTSSPWEIR